MSLQVWLPLNGNINNIGVNGSIVPSTLGTVSYVNNGKIGKAFQSGGTTQVQNGVSLNTNFLDIFGTTASVAAWVKPLGDHYHYNGTILSSGNWNAKRWAFGVSQDNTKVDLLSGGYNIWLDCPVPVNEWTHLACVYNNGTSTLYKNGVLVGSRTGLAAFDSDAENTCVGRETYASGYFGFYGYINDVRIYDHCLSAKEVKEISKGLALHYKFDHDGLGNENIVSGVLDGLPVLTTRTDGRWCNLSGGNASVSIVEDSTAYIGNYVYKIVGNTSGNKDVSQYNTANPFSLVSGNTYTMSAYYRGSGKTLIRIWDATSGSQLVGGSQNFDTNGAWERISYTFTATSAMASGHNLGFLFGITGIGTTDICGMKVEAGSVATAWSPSSIETYWESYSNVIRDSSGFGNDGVIVGNSSYVLDSPRYDMSFYMSNSSTSNHVEVSNAFTFDNSKVSVSLWTNATKSRNQVIFADKNLVIEFAFLNSVAFLYPTSSKSGFSLANYTSGQWNHIVAIKNGSTYSLYVNGQLASSSGSNYYIHNAEQMWILNRSYNNTYAAIAGISDFRVYSTILSGDDVLELYHTSASVDHDGSVYAREIVEA